MQQIALGGAPNVMKEPKSARRRLMSACDFADRGATDYKTKTWHQKTAGFPATSVAGSAYPVSDFKAT